VYFITNAAGRVGKPQTAPYDDDLDHATAPSSLDASWRAMCDLFDETF